MRHICDRSGVYASADAARKPGKTATMFVSLHGLMGGVECAMLVSRATLPSLRLRLYCYLGLSPKVSFQAAVPIASMNPAGNANAARISGAVRPDSPAEGSGKVGVAVTANQQGPVASLCLGGELTIYRAVELKEAMLTALDGAAALELDLSSVTELDTAGVQLLLLIHQTARARSKQLRLTAPSSAVLEVFELLHLDPHFGDWPMASPNSEQLQ